MPRSFRHDQRHPPTVPQHDPRLAAGFTTRTFAPTDETLGAARTRLCAQEGFAQVASVGQVHGADVATVERADTSPRTTGS